MAETALSFAMVKLEDQILGIGGNTYDSGPSSDVMGAHILAAHHYMSSNGYRARMERPCTMSRVSFLLGVTAMTQWLEKPVLGCGDGGGAGAGCACLELACGYTRIRD
jgi:hypothetical protein